MRTWNEYKSTVKRTDANDAKDIEEIEAIAAIVSKLVEKRNNLGITQRDLRQCAESRNRRSRGSNPITQHRIWISF